MTFDSPLFSFVKVTNFTEESLVTPEGVEGEKKIVFKINLSMQGIESNPGCLREFDGVDCIKVSYKIKASISHPLHYPSLRKSILGIKAYLLL